MAAIAALTQEQKEALLTERELREYRIYMRLQQPPMAPSTQARFFALFLNGLNCEEIHRLNPNGFSLGAIVRARLENDWDLKRLEHQEQLMARVRERVQQVTLETVERIANELAASNKLVNDKVLKYLQTGDPAELAGTNIGSVRHLKEMVELLAKLTGQDAKKTQVGGTVEHRHTIAQEAPAQQAVSMPVLPVGKPMDPQVVADALDAIYRHRGGK
jgi:hypothetical protein